RLLPQRGHRSGRLPKHFKLTGREASGGCQAGEERGRGAQCLLHVSASTYHQAHWRGCQAIHHDAYSAVTCRSAISDWMAAIVSKLLRTISSGFRLIRHRSSMKPTRMKIPRESSKPSWMSDR